MSTTEFKLTTRHHIPSLHLDLEMYTHGPTGARHVHLRADDPHNVFLVAFLTVPQDSTGVAHILEHTALCGSRRYPVRDPFFMMIRRSLNTFMNAFTASDWTAYPFASQNRRDFDNLLDVYLDAAFFPLLDELDFAQEGHRLEFSLAEDPASPLLRGGVVYNEMKGAMSSPVSRLAQSLQSHLFPTTTYHWNSGGDPREIPHLTHAALKEFHARHYHPSNAVFMTYGDIPAHEHHERFHDRVLRHFDALTVDFQVPDEHRNAEPVRVQASYPLDASEGGPEDHTHVVLGWLLGRATDPLEVLRARILAAALLDNSSSPLRHALETSELGTAPSPLCGFDDNTRETTFTCGLEGCADANADRIEREVLDVLERVAREGIAPEALEAVLHQLELSQREVTGDGFPYGLRLLLDALPPTLHGGDPAAALDLDPLLEQLREEISAPDFIQGLVRRMLLDNPHRVRLVMRPDGGLAAREQAEERDALDRIGATLDAGARSVLAERARALAERQARKDDPDILPRVTLADVPLDIPIPVGERRDLGSVPATWYSRPTNGMVYLQLVMDLPALPEELLDLLPVYTMCLTEVGSGGRGYLATQALQARYTGGLSARTMVRTSLADRDRADGVLVLSGKALARNHAHLARLLADTLAAPQFGERERVRELVAQLHAQREESVSDHGHMLALAAASAGISRAAALGHRWDGLAGLEVLRRLSPRLGEAATLTQLAERLATVHEHLTRGAVQALVIAEENLFEAVSGSFGDALARLSPGNRADALEVQTMPLPPAQGWAINAQVNFCARAFPVVPAGHPDAPALQVLGDYLRNVHLHRAIREKGGAYGAGAGYNGDTATFRFYSYRDPRLEQTLADFEASVKALLEEPQTPSDLEEAILGVVGAIDRPGSPAGEAIGTFYAGLFGRSPEVRRAFRRAVLAVTMDDLRRVASEHLVAERGRTAVLGPSEAVKHIGAAAHFPG